MGSRLRDYSPRIRDRSDRDRGNRDRDNYSSRDSRPHFKEWDVRCKVYIGNMGPNGSKQEIESVFGKYGGLKNVWIARNPPGFAFVEFEDSRDAEDAVRALDGTKLSGSKIRVEMSSGRTRRDEGRRGGGDDGRRGGGFGGSRRDDRRGGRNRSRSRSPRRRSPAPRRSRSRDHSDSRSVSRDRR